MNKALLFYLTTIVFFSQILLAQDKKISGIVTGTDSSKVIYGATVTVKGTATGTFTNDQGKYTLIVPASATTLIFSSAGTKHWKQ